jgi:uncharacterized membrane protein
MSERKLTTWQAAGLIDSATVARIRDYERAHSRPLALWSLIGIGALAIGLGLISVVAANWDDIPGLVRLSAHMLLMVSLAAYMGFTARAKTAANTNEYFNDAQIFILGALGLTFFGHLGQVYQTSSPLWQPLALWMLLFTPVMLGMGRGWPVALMWMVGLIGTTMAHIDHSFDLSARNTLSVAYQALIITPPIIAAIIATYFREHSDRSDFWRRLVILSLTTIIGGVSIATIAQTSALTHMAAANWGEISVALMQALLLMIGAFAVYQIRRHATGIMAAQLLALCGLIIAAIALIGDSDIGAAILFMLLWTGIAACALMAGIRWLFQVAVAVIALRLIILSFELANDLLGSGIGLILVGIFTLGVAWGALTISRRFAPSAEEDAA